MADDELGKALAPDDSLFDVVEEGEITDPLEGGDIIIDEEDPLAFEVEEPISGSNLAALPDMAIEMTGDSLENPEDEIEIVENVPDEDVVEMPEDQEEAMLVDEFDDFDYDQPGKLVASIVNEARKFAEYDTESPNSMRRALALCDRLENMIIVGVAGDCKDQKLSLAHMKLLDDIEEGIGYTRSFLTRKGNKKVVQATRNAENSIFYDPFCVTVARILINGQVQGGKKVQDLFASMKDKYGINDREALQVSQIMMDMGYPVRSLIDGEDMIEQRYA